MNRKNPSIGRTNPIVCESQSELGREFGRPLSRGEFHQAGWLRYSSVVVGSLLACLSVTGQAQDDAPAQEKVSSPGQPDYYAPWSGQTPKTNSAPAAPKPVAAPKSEAKPETSPQPPMAMPLGAMGMPAPPKTTRNEIALSADYVLGQGNVTLPFGSGLAASGLTVPRSVEDADRESTYYGATYAYSLGQAWYIDLAYSTGDTSGNFTINFGGLPTPMSVSIKDDWYQIYLRYTFPQLRGKRFQAYLRGGVSYVQSDLSADFKSGALTYNQQTETGEYYGNLGLGATYPLYRKGRFQIRLNADAEIFAGQRSTDVKESVTLVGLGLVNPPSGTDSFDGLIYGGYSRATIRFQYELTESGLLRAFLDGGGQVKYSQIDYPNGWFDELLWGPYVRCGLLYSF